MNNPSVRAAALGAILAAVAVLGVTIVNAATPYDGQWSVTISTSRGDCGSNSLYGVNIRNGSVSYAGGAGAVVRGSVSGSGHVSVSVSQGQQSASGSGRLSTNGTGRGSWSGSGPTGRCSGSWSAQRG
jgi:hypothetical protein